MAKLRFMPLYVEDLLSDATVDQMDAATFGAHLRLLCYGWKDRGLPEDPERLRRMARVLHGMTWKHIWPVLEPKWPVIEDPIKGRCRVNRKQEDVRLGLERYRMAQSNRAKQRWEPDAVALQPGNASEPNPNPAHSKDPSDPCAPRGAPHQGEFDLEKGALPTEAGDLPAGEAIYAVFNHWRERYPEHQDAQLQGKRPALIKAAIANRRAAHGGACKFSRRQAVDEIQGAIDAAKLDPWCAGQNQERTAVTELSALLAIEVLERLCRLATGERPAQVFVNRGQTKIPEAM